MDSRHPEGRFITASLGKWTERKSCSLNVRELKPCYRTDFHLTLLFFLSFFFFSIVSENTGHFWLVWSVERKSEIEQWIAIDWRGYSWNYVSWMKTNSWLPAYRLFRVFMTAETLCTCRDCDNSHDPVSFKHHLFPVLQATNIKYFFSNVCKCLLKSNFFYRVYSLFI